MGFHVFNAYIEAKKHHFTEVGFKFFEEMKLYAVAAAVYITYDVTFSFCFLNPEFRLSIEK